MPHRREKAQICKINDTKSKTGKKKIQMSDILATDFLT